MTLARQVQMTNVKQDPNNKKLKSGDLIYDYKVLRADYLGEISAFFYELVHEPTGARHIHLSNSDTENTFSVAFKTVPQDSTGVAHILEHTALCGSEKFPVRDPFFSMIKRSLNTFMNAFTASDWTMYPFSTQNRKDYRNLTDVYLDAAFFPKLDELSFMQEGHRMELEPLPDNGGEQLVYKGVVYNEMKGAMSSPSQVLGRSMLNALYPTTTYGWNSGGEPEIIPELTHEALKEFHRKHYHPSNAWFYTYGNIPLEETLGFIESKVLSHFSGFNPGTEVPNEPRWDQPKEKKYYYPLDKSEAPEKKCQVSVGWLTADITDSFEVLVLSLLNHILLGNSASPLRKALIDSGIGTALCDATGFDADNRDTMFCCGLKGVDASDADKITTVIFDTLSDLADKGIDPELITTAIHQIEFRQKEVTNSPYPYGIKCLLRMCGSWFHGGDPAKTLQLDSDFQRLDQEMAKGQFFENRIRTWFLENTHRVQLTLVPDRGLEEERNRAVRKRLDSVLDNMGDAEKERLRSAATALETLQETEEDLSCLPTLKISDIPSDVKIIKQDTAYPSIPAACYRQPTSGIFYFSSVAGIENVPASLLPMVPFFSLSFTKAGTGKRDYTSLARQISSVTGGLGMAAHARTGFDGSAACRPFISFGGKCLERNQDKMFDLIHECMTEYDFSDTERIRSILNEYKAGLEASVVQNGHALAITGSAQGFSDACMLNEIWNGIEQIRYISRLGDELEKDADGTLSRIRDGFGEIANAIFASADFRFALVGEDEMIQNASGALSSLNTYAASAPETPVPSLSVLDSSAGDDLLKKGWITNAAVAYVGASFKAVPMGHEDAPGFAVISKLLRSNYLHREIREKGGAYGGFAVYNSEEGTFSFGSYRDPHICRTLDVYSGAGDYLKSGNFSDTDITESILQLASVIDKPDTPATGAKKAFYRSVLSLSDEMRQAYKERLLKMDRKTILNLSEKYFSDLDDKLSVSVISGSDKLASANEKLGNKSLELNRILG